MAVATLVGAFACSSDATGPTVSVNLTLIRMASVASAQVASGLAAAVQTAEGRIDLSTVSSFTMNLQGVEVHTPGSGWVGVDLSADPVTLDLLALPSESADAIVLGTIDGLVPGECRVRLFLSEAAIMFSTEVVVGNVTFAADTDHGAELRIPSGEQTGLKAEGACTVPEGGGEVSLLFDEGATLGTITATGSGKILVSPVIHVQTENGGA